MKTFLKNLIRRLLKWATEDSTQPAPAGSKYDMTHIDVKVGSDVVRYAVHTVEPAFFVCSANGKERIVRPVDVVDIGHFMAIAANARAGAGGPVWEDDGHPADVTTIFP